MTDGEASTITPADPHAMHGVHLAPHKYVVAGVGATRPNMIKLDAFLARYDLCDNLSDYKSPLAVNLDAVGDKCKKNLKWTWNSKHDGKDMFGYVAASPDGSYLIAAGIMTQGTGNNKD